MYTAALFEHHRFASSICACTESDSCFVRCRACRLSLCYETFPKCVHSLLDDIIRYIVPDHECAASFTWKVLCEHFTRVQKPKVLLTAGQAVVPTGRIAVLPLL